MGSWNVSGEAAGAGWRIEGTADATGRGGEGENGEMESEGEEDGKLAMEDGRWEVSWFDSPSPVRAPWPMGQQCGRNRPASTAGSPGTPARIESDDGQDSRHAGLPRTALCPTRLNPPEQAARTACGAQSLPYGTRTRRLFSNFATPNGEATLPNRDKTHNTWHFAVPSVGRPLASFTSTGGQDAHGQRATPLPLVLALPRSPLRIGKTSEF